MSNAIKFLFLLIGFFAILDLVFIKMKPIIEGNEKLQRFSPKPSMICVVSAWQMKPEDIIWLESLPYPVVAYSENLRPTVNDRHKTEAGKYTHFMCTHFETLPDLILFLHGHANAWHRTPEIVQELISNIEAGRLNPSKMLNDFAYISFSKERWSDGNLERIITLLNYAWNKFLGKYFLKPLEEYRDFITGRNCCSEFVVTSTQIRLRPRELWCDFFNFLNDSESVSKEGTSFVDVSDDKIKGMIFEWFVPLLFSSYK
jgi:hypothetical protein